MIYDREGVPRKNGAARVLRHTIRRWNHLYRMIFMTVAGPVGPWTTVQRLLRRPG